MLLTTITLHLGSDRAIVNAGSAEEHAYRAAGYIDGEPAALGAPVPAAEPDADLTPLKGRPRAAKRG